MIRQSLLLTACAIAPFVITGCADDKAAAETTQPAAVAVDSPAPAASDLGKELAALSARIRLADASLERVVGDSATDPEDRLVAFNKSVAAIGPVTATSLAAKLKTDGEAILAGWEASLAAATDAEMRKVIAAGQAEAKTRFAELDKALRGTDAALLYHTTLLRDVRAALGSRPNSTQLVAARPVSKRVSEAGTKVTGWLNYASIIAKKAGAAPLPAPVAPAPKAEESHPAPEAPVTPVAEKPAAPAPAPVAPVAAAPAAPVAPAPAPEVKPAAPVAKPVEPAEPKPTAQPDPVPEPVDA
jgi:hypothetical protein